ncbi:YgdI/YgdR family lipoprotein [Pseudomonas bananamidigenes]|uniref:YgdI/YgdR family lipoprotein n=1 Tax=Pseudomonas bananamidigenes TaxID=2843610 RepID=UPI0008033690|nr:YgdI/YgdR family lipoprotein [Pseudomonas bananamidigenes]
MNFRTLGLSVTTVALLALAGCSTPTVVTLQNGTQYLTKDMPKTKSEDGFYEFRDISGTKIRVKADDVATVRKED